MTQERPLRTLIRATKEREAQLATEKAAAEEKAKARRDSIVEAWPAAVELLEKAISDANADLEAEDVPERFRAVVGAPRMAVGSCEIVFGIPPQTKASATVVVSEAGKTHVRYRHSVRQDSSDFDLSKCSADHWANVLTRLFRLTLPKQQKGE